MNVTNKHTRAERQTPEYQSQSDQNNSEQVQAATPKRLPIGPSVAADSSPTGLPTKHSVVANRSFLKEKIKTEGNSTSSACANEVCLDTNRLHKGTKESSNTKQTASEKLDRPRPLSTRVNMVWNSLGSLTYLGCQWLITILVIRLASTADAGYAAAGILSLAMGVTGIFGTLANYKMGTYQVSDIRHEHKLGEYLGFRAFMLIAAFIFCMVYAAITCAPYTLITIALFYIFKAVGLFIDVMHGTDQLNRRMDYIGLSFMLQGGATLAAFIVVYWVFQNLDAAIVAMTGAALLVLILWDVRKVRQFEPVRITLTRSKAFFFLKTSAPAVVASVAASALFTIPKQYLAVASGDAALGIYSAVAAPALIIQMGAVYIYSPLLDLFPRRFFANDKQGFLRLLSKATLGIIFVGGVCALLLEVFGTWLLSLLFGESIVPYVYLLQPVILATVATAFLWFLGDLLITLRNFRAYFAGNVAAVIVVIPASFYCIDVWDMNGVSFAGTIACAVGIALLLLALIRTVKRGPAPQDLYQPKESADYTSEDFLQSKPKTGHTSQDLYQPKTTTGHTPQDSTMDQTEVKHL